MTPRATSARGRLPEVVTEVVRETQKTGAPGSGSGSRRPKRPSVTELDGRRILVVDDQPAMRATMAVLLRSLGAEVEIAASGGEALKRCAHPPPFDAVLLDAHMPGLDGFALARLLRAAHPGTRLVLCTGADEDAVRRALASGQVQCAVRKPFDVPELVAALAPR